MKPKIGLVIQGALLSIGRTGDKLHQTPAELMKNGGVIEYDTRENVNKIIKEYGHLFDEIVVSVFDNQLRPDEYFEGAKIVSAPDPGGIKQVGHYKDNNKARQFLSTLNGLLELEKSGMDYAVKIRTDIHLDLTSMLGAFFEGIKDGNHSAIYATVTNPPTFLLHDLYFAAELKALKNFCEAILGYDRFEFISSVHRDMILKHAYMFYKDEIKVPEWAYFPIFPPGGVCKETRAVFDYMFKHIYRSLPEEIFRQTLWRGTYFGADHFEMIFGGQKSRKYNIPHLISIDWKRYHHFRLQVFGERIGLMDQLRERIGKWGWDLWEFIKKIVRMVR
jgi:hypothetical protein